MNTWNHHRLHVAVYYLLRFLLRPFLWWIYRFQTEDCRPQTDAPCLIYVNHVTWADPFMIGLAFPKHLYFVASEHLLRQKTGWWMRVLAGPILHQKSRMGIDTTREIFARLRAGCNVCIFVETQRTMSGVTCPIPDSAAKLAKVSGAALVTYRLEDGYLTDPRWAVTVRKGGMGGRMVHCYPPDSIKEMSTATLQKAIREDLYLDAYAVQEKEMKPYPGKRLAEHLEAALCLCPLCHRIGTLASADDRFFCSCGFSLRYTTYGLFAGEGEAPVPFANVRDWYLWQQAQITALAKQEGNEPLLFDDEVDLFVSKGAAQTRLGRGRLAMYRDRIEFSAGDVISTFALAEVSKLACHERMLFSFSIYDTLYEVLPAQWTCTEKYQWLFAALKAQPVPERK